MTNWQPDPSLLRRPAYLSLAEQIARAIQDGALPSGHRLPPHRTMADSLQLSVQTVSRAYDELIRRGLTAGPQVARTLRTIEHRWADSDFPTADRFEALVAKASVRKPLVRLARKRKPIML